jgi:type I restriction enzyme S subunit
MVVEAIAKRAIGATMLNLNTSILREVSLPVPPREIQRKIADMLSTYDGLIENNTKRIKVVEEMAHSLYREWFANVRFPG